MASASVRRGWLAFGALVVWICRLAVVLALVGAWTALELRAVRQRTVADFSNAGTVARDAIDTLLAHVGRVGGAIDAADLATPDRIALTAHLLRLDPLVSPARGLFLYDAAGRFLAATEPLSPAGGEVADRFWFQNTLAQPGLRTPLVSPPTTDPVTDARGFLLTRAIADTAGRAAGVVGTLLRPQAMRALLVPTILTRPGTILLTRADGVSPVFRVVRPAGPASPRQKLFEHAIHRLLHIVGWSPVVQVSLPLAGGLMWQARLDFVSGMTAQERSDLLWHSGLLALGAVILAFLIRLPAPRREASAALGGGTPALAPELDVEWIWEIDQRGLLVGVAGNAPESLVAAVGADFLAMAEGDGRAAVLRNALVKREAIADLDLALTLPSSAGGARRRFRLNGRPVAETGGMWGSAREILSEPEARRGSTRRMPDPVLRMSG